MILIKYDKYTCSMFFFVKVLKHVVKKQAISNPQRFYI